MYNIKVESHKVKDRHWLKHYIGEVVSFVVIFALIFILVRLYFYRCDKLLFNGRVVQSNIKR